MNNEEIKKLEKQPKWVQEILSKLTTESYTVSSIYGKPLPYTADEIKAFCKASQGKPLKGFFINSYARDIHKGCTDTVCHSRRNTNKTESKNMALNMYKSLRDAKVALAIEFERDFKVKLRRMDERYPESRLEND